MSIRTFLLALASIAALATTALAPICISDPGRCLKLEAVRPAT